MYRQKEIDLILQNIDLIQDKAKTIYLNTYEPTLDETRNVMNDIKTFIQDKKRIIYGGYAQNELIRSKSENDVFYKEIDLADIEFYTPDPIGDMIDLCDLLYKKQYKYIQGKEGVHNETYKIFINFLNYCDISYMPQEIYDNIPTVTINGLLLTHPHFMLIDAYRVYTDPMTSYFRLKKTFVRFTKLINLYPFNENMIYNKLEYSDYNKNKTNIKNMLKYIKKNILINSKLIVIGHHAFNYLIKKAKMPSTFKITKPFYQVISTNYSHDVDKIHNLLKKKYTSIVKKSFYPFSQFLDRSSEWYIDNILVFRVYSSYDKCSVYQKSNKNINYGTFQLVFLYTLIHYIRGIIKKNKFNETVYGTMLVRLLKARDTFLDTNNKTVLDNTPFEEFTLKCIGEPKDLLRSSFLDKEKKKDSGKQISFSYKPRGNSGKKPIYTFENTSGMEKHSKKRDSSRKRNFGKITWKS